MSNIVAIAKGPDHTLGNIVFLRNDGLVSTMVNYRTHKEVGLGFYDLESFFKDTDITELAILGSFIYALRENGTVVYTSIHQPGYCQVLEGWNDINSITAGSNALIGLRRNRTLVAHGTINPGMLETITSSDWTNIQMVAINDEFPPTSIVALRNDGTILNTRWFDNGEQAENLIFNNW